MAFLNLLSLWNVRGLILSGYSDFITFYSAGLLVRTGHGRDLSDPARQFLVQQQFSQLVQSRGKAFPYIHPAFESLFFIPLSYFSYLTAYLLWTAINCLLLVLIFFLLRPQIPLLRRLPFFLWVISVVAFFPVIPVLSQGQDDLLLLLLFGLTFLAFLRRSTFSAGAWLGLGMFRPQFALPLAGVLLCAGEWQALGGFLLVVSGLGFLTVGLFGWSQLLDYPRHVWISEQASNPGGVLLGDMPNLHGLVSGLVPGSRTAAYAIAMLSLAFLFLAGRGWQRSQKDAFGLAFSMSVLAVVLASYHAFGHDLCLLLLPVLLQLNWLLTRRSQMGMSWPLVGPMLILFISPLSFWLVQHARYNLFAIVLMIWFLGHALALRNSSVTGT